MQHSKCASVSDVGVMAHHGLLLHLHQVHTQHSKHKFNINTLHYITPHHTTPHHTTPQYTTPQSTTINRHYTTTLLYNKTQHQSHSHYCTTIQCKHYCNITLPLIQHSCSRDLTQSQLHLQMHPLTTSSTERYTHHHALLEMT
jgi:hypothetical protein